MTKFVGEQVNDQCMNDPPKRHNHNINKQASNLKVAQSKCAKICLSVCVRVRQQVMSESVTERMKEGVSVEVWKYM